MIRSSFAGAFFGAVVFASAAFSADMPLKAPIRATAAPAFTWTGCYIGGHFGGLLGRERYTDTTGNFITRDMVVDQDIRGVIGGGQIGCDYQASTNWIVGLEGQFSWSNAAGDIHDPFSDPGVGGFQAFLHARTEWLSSGTARVGYTWDRWMIYAKGGAAWAHDRYTFDGVGFLGPGPFAFNGSETRVGWTVGAGAELAFAQNWSAKLEYSYYDFGNQTSILSDRVFGTQPIGVEQTIHTVKVGLNYRFWTDAGPILAKY